MQANHFYSGDHSNIYCVEERMHVECELEGSVMGVKPCDGTCGPMMVDFDPSLLVEFFQEMDHARRRRVLIENPFAALMKAVEEKRLREESPGQ
jgi:hypothetical protein